MADDFPFEYLGLLSPEAQIMLLANKIRKLEDSLEVHGLAFQQIHAIIHSHKAGLENHDALLKDLVDLTVAIRERDNAVGAINQEQGLNFNAGQVVRFPWGGTRPKRILLA